MTKHTSGKWMLGKQDRPIGYFPIYARIGVTKLACICKTDAHEIGFGISEAEHKANAAFIVRACNCHDELVEALKHIKSEYGYCLPEKTMQKINKAIAKAEGDWEDSLIERPEIGREG